MKDESKTNKQLLEELSELQGRILSLERSNKKLNKDQDELKQSEKRLRLIFENAPEGIYQTTPEGRFISMNPAFARICGYDSSEEMIHSVTHIKKQLYVNPENRDQVKKVLAEKGILKGFEAPFYRKDGKIIWVSIYVQAVKDGDGKIFYQGTIEDITERRQAEAALKEKVEDLSHLATVLSDSNDAVIMHDLEGKILAWNRGARETYGYTEAEALERNVRDIVAEADREAALTLIQKIKHGEIVKSFELRRVTKDGRILNVWLTTTLLTNEKGNPAAIVTTERDITERKISAERLRKALDATVYAIALIVETRDPYTAGHQRKVADLACAIAEEMNLSTEQVESIRLVGIIHDIGKISVPAEILSKPTKLTNLEFSLIRTHSQSGYDMLKGIDFPWSIARMVLEHHERIDGSGYPNGLTGNKLLIESRILSVADVVEAMASHRPYRPSLGIDVALEEISKNKGILYDAAVGDACIRLFREKGYKITD